MSSAQNSDADREDFVVCVLEFAGDQGAATAALQRVFGLNEADARAILADVPVAVRRGVNRIRAEYFRRALELSGARVEVRDGAGEVVPLQTPGRAQPSAPLAPKPAGPATAPQPTAAVPPNPPSPFAQPAPSFQRAGATIAGTGPLTPPPSAAVPVVPSAAGKTLAFGTARTANDTDRASTGGWGDLEPRKPVPRPTTQKIQAPASPAAPAHRPPSQPLDAPVSPSLPGIQKLEPRQSLPEPEQRAAMQPNAEWALSLEDEGPLDSPLNAATDTSALELASTPSPGKPAPRQAAGSTADHELDEKAAAGPSLELQSDPRGLQREAPPKYGAIPAGERWKAPGTNTLAKAHRQQAIQAAESGLGDSSPPDQTRRSRPQPAARPNSRELGRPSGEAAQAPASPDALHLKAGAPADTRRGRGSAAHAMPRADEPSGRQSTRREPFVSPALSRARARGVELGFWEATKLGFSGTSISWIAKIAGAAVVLAGLADLSVRVPALGLPLLLIGLTCLLGLCSEYHRYVFWAAATREESLRERPALSVAAMMRDGVHLTGFALVSQLLVWFWLAGQLHDGHRPIAIVFSPSLWVLGFGPGFYWPIALACAAAQNRASGVWDLPLGLRALGRAPAEVGVVVLATSAAFLVSMMIAAVLVSATSLDPALALFTAAGLPVAISHALAGVWMGRVVHRRPDLFE
jgi:hypothetical protein